MDRIPALICSAIGWPDGERECRIDERTAASPALDQKEDRSIVNGETKIFVRKGVTGGLSGPTREGPGVGHKIVSDTKQMREKWTEINGKRYRNALRHGQRQK